MTGAPPASVSRARRLAATVAVLAIAGGGALVIGGRDATGIADIEFQQARLREVGGYTLLDARAEVQLPMTVRQGLDSGVPLDFVVRLSVLEPRRFWFDRVRHRHEWRQRLVYYELTRHYRLTGGAVGADAPRRGRNYRSLLAALDGLGTMRNLEAGDLAIDSLDADWRARLDMRLDTRALPLPLQPLIGTSWRLRSAPFSWAGGAESTRQALASIDAATATGASR